MRFPLRFTSDLQLGVVARGMRARGQAPLVLKLSPQEETTAVVLPSVESAPRLVWIGGAEPLEHPEIARFANALAQKGSWRICAAIAAIFRNGISSVSARTL